MDFREHKINRHWSPEEKIDLLRQMRRIRRFEQMALKYFNGCKINGWLILSVGQESVAAGVRSLMGRLDHSISGPRGIGHALAAGMPMGPCMAELFGLPVVYVIENNGYAMGMSVARSSRFKECLAKRAEGYDIDWDRCGDGDIYQLRVKVWTALERARHERRPTVLEVDTYRYYGFTVSDANTKRYRRPEEIAERKLRDPLRLWQQHLLDEGVLDEAAAEKIDLAAIDEALEAVRFAESSPPPSVSNIVRDVYWESDHDTAASRIGRHFFGE